MPPELHFDLAKIDLTNIVVDKEGIHKVLPQRFEMEQLDAIVHLDLKGELIVGYKDVRHDEFWVRGHMPGYPLMPGVMLCEAAAQLSSFFVVANKLAGGDFIGFAGLENVRFRGTVHPGDRLILVGKAVKLHRRQTIFNVQGFVKEAMVFHGDVIGVPMTRAAEPAK
ncbi:MAG: 3-hydroxyacyl-ACP dehydratase FabZ family protein [Planctomycetota bacterium]|jgi:3-hydroxyacyl-[acyl-carrier-protein] dehydratase